MYGDYYPHREQLTEPQIHAIERITDLEDYLNRNAAKGETFEIAPLALPGNEWAVRLTHTNPFGHKLAYDGFVELREFQKGLHDVGIDFQQLGHKVVVASRGESYYGQAKTFEALSGQYKDTFDVLRGKMPMKPYHMDLYSDGSYTVHSLPERAKATFTRHANAQTLYRQPPHRQAARKPAAAAKSSMFDGLRDAAARFTHAFG